MEQSYYTSYEQLERLSMKNNAKAQTFISLINLVKRIKSG